MSIDEARPEEWDAIKADRCTDNRDPKEVPATWNAPRPRSCQFACPLSGGRD